MSKIKLLKVDEMEDGTLRLQSQLMVGRDSVDFILKDGILKNWCYLSGGVGFHETDISYEIVNSKKNIIKQLL